jgi:hypothetical protein
VLVHETISRLYMLNTYNKYVFALNNALQVLFLPSTKYTTHHMTKAKIIETPADHDPTVLIANNPFFDGIGQEDISLLNEYTNQLGLNKSEILFKE